MLPGTLTTTIFGEQIQVALEDPSRINYALVGGVVVFFLGLIYVVRRWFVKQHRIGQASEPS
jgi:phospholipase D1/2